MNVIAQLSLSQLKNNKKRTFWAAAAILLATALLTCVCSLAVSGYEMLTSFLGGDFGTYRSAYFSLLLIPAAVLGLIILLMAVIVISNVFRASAADRTAEFGMLKCVGATGAQIRKFSVLRRNTSRSADRRAPYGSCHSPDKFLSRRAECAHRHHADKNSLRTALCPVAPGAGTVRSDCCHHRLCSGPDTGEKSRRRKRGGKHPSSFFGKPEKFSRVPPISQSPKIS